MDEKTLCFLIRGNPPQEVLLGLKKIGFGAGKFTGIGGGVENGESIEAAAIRELEEEIGIKTSIHELYPGGQLTFLFPFKPSWSQVVHVFLVRKWQGDPVESMEIKPDWWRFDTIPYVSMWDDASYWLPLVLQGKKVKATIIFKDDNETVSETKFENWDDVEQEKTTQGIV